MTHPIVRIATLDDIAQFLAPISQARIVEGVETLAVNLATELKVKGIGASNLAAQHNISADDVRKWMELDGYDLRGEEIRHILLHNRYEGPDYL